MKYIKLSFLLILILTFFSLTDVFADGTALVKIGLYYSSSARDEYTVSSSDGLYAADESSDELFNLSANSVKVKSDTSYHLRLYFGLELPELSEKLEELKAESIKVFPVYNGDNFEIWH